MEGDLIFVNTDPGVTIGLEALKELEDQKRLEEMNQQTAWLSAIQSNVKDKNNEDRNNKDENNIFKFGKVTPDEHASAFGKTASAVFRMVMLHAVQIEDTVWPSSKNTKGRNRKALRFEVSEQFKNKDALQLDKKKVQLYSEKYDQVFPLSLISRKLLTNLRKPVSFHNKMLIFRNNFTDVIIIETTANATMYPPRWKPGEFDSNVSVTCTRKVIKPEDGEYFKKLKRLFSGAGQEQAQTIARTRSDVWDQLKKDIDFNKKLKEEAKLKTDKDTSVSKQTDEVKDLTIQPVPVTTSRRRSTPDESTPDESTPDESTPDKVDD